MQRPPLVRVAIVLHSPVGNTGNSLMNSAAALTLAIVTEVAGTTFLQLSQQLTKPVPALVMGLCYLASLYFLSLALRTIPIGIAYGIWSGLGIVLICGYRLREIPSGA